MLNVMLLEIEHLWTWVLRYTDTLPFCCNASSRSAHNFSFAVTRRKEEEAELLLRLALTADDGRTTYSL